MTNYIALIRGINVGGHKKFPKADQLKMIQALKFDNPQLYIHTGNWMFQSSLKGDKVADLIQQKITKDMGWEVPVIVLSATEMETILAKCPFSEEKKQESYFVIIEAMPLPEKLALLDDVSVPNEEFVVGDRCIYFYPALGAGKAKLSNNFFEKKLKVNATTRNFRTMAKLTAMATSL